MAGPVLKVLLTFWIFDYSFLLEDSREVPIVGRSSPQLEYLILVSYVVSSLSINITREKK